MKLRPTGYYVLVQQEEVEKISEGGIILGSSAENKRDQAGHDVVRVLAFGPTCFTGFRGVNDESKLVDRCCQYGVKIGDLVQIARYDVAEARHADKDIFMIQDEHIRGVYDE